MASSDMHKRMIEAAEAPVVRVPIQMLVSADSPRLAGESVDHIRVLAESNTVTPPIIVHRPTMRVVDGMHRMRAALLRGECEIDVRFIGGDTEDVFVVAVRTNVAHGLPLSHRDRTAAANRIARTHPNWSDRAIAAAVGLSPKTVGSLRRRSSEEIPQSNRRVGRDGRVRALKTGDARKRAAELLADQPEASLREIARQAGVSPSTVHDVRKRQQANRTAGPVDVELSERRARNETAATLRAFRADPSVRLTESGRTLIRLLDAHTLDQNDWSRLAATIPAHCNEMVAELARRYATTWQTFASQVERRGPAVAG